MPATATLQKRADALESEYARCVTGHKARKQLWLRLNDLRTRALKRGIQKARRARKLERALRNA